MSICNNYAVKKADKIYALIEGRTYLNPNLLAISNCQAFSEYMRTLVLFGIKRLI